MMKQVSRRSFLKAAGVATGAAAVSASPAIAKAIDQKAVETTRTGPLPQEPIVAIISNPGRGEMVVLSGLTEKTYKDDVLVKRLLKAVQQNHVPKGKEAA